jgi:hypothetical protein
MDLSILRKQFFNIELLLTEQCNFTCEHCMYDCSPYKSNLWMNNEILDKVKKQVDFLKNSKVMTVVNLIGGEPTLNFTKFAHILKKVYSWKVNITMSTNGWWLNTEENIQKFFSIVSQYANPDGSAGWEKMDSAFSVRISDDPYHEKVRKIKNIGYALDKIFKNIELVNKFHIPFPDKKSPWIFPQPWRNGYYYVAPNGRGKNISNLDYYLEVTGKTLCFKDIDNTVSQSIHYDPQGKITDACGFGSIYDFGTVDDNILFIEQLIEEYKIDRKKSGKVYNCYTCREMVNEWKETNLQKAREKYCYLNTFVV